MKKLWHRFAATRVFLVIISVALVLNVGMAVFSALHGAPLATACSLVGALGALIGIAGHFSLRLHDPRGSN